jgi:hypothetical protein
MDIQNDFHDCAGSGQGSRASGTFTLSAILQLGLAAAPQPGLASSLARRAAC